jgi:hypothetical protein
MDVISRKSNLEHLPMVRGSFAGALGRIIDLTWPVPAHYHPVDWLL